MSRRLVEASVFVVAIVLVLALPLVAGTHTYPLTVVEGNSMNPTFVNGDLVYYTYGKVSNGSIIVFTQGGADNPLFGGLVDQVVIHRVIGVVVEDDGLVCYRTQGDNNKAPDGTLVPSNHVLGVKTLVIPRVGLLFLFLHSPQGLIAVVSLIVVFYLSVYETRAWKEKKKKAFLGQLAQKTLAGQISKSRYEKFELTIQNIEHIDPSQIGASDARALATWLKGSLEGDWTISNNLCSTCGRRTLVFEGSRLVLLVGCDTVGESAGVSVYAKQRGKPLKRCSQCLGN